LNDDGIAVGSGTEERGSVLVKVGTGVMVGTFVMFKDAAPQLSIMSGLCYEGVALVRVAIDLAAVVVVKSCHAHSQEKRDIIESL
jgi:hypothetical protein